MKNYIELLQQGKTISFRPRGNSMTGKIENGNLITVSPDISSLNVGDIVFCKVNGRIYVHLIRAISGDSYQICNNRGRVNGWTKNIFGKVIRIEK